MNPSGKSLEQIGIEFVMKNLDKFASGAAQYGKQVADMNKASVDFAKQADKSAEAGKKMGEGTKAAGAGAAAGAKGVGIFGAAINFALGPIGLAIGAISAITAAVGALGMRGAEIRGIETAFANIIAPILKADESVQDFVTNLRNAAGDTISQLDLLRSTNLALAGTSGELKETFARSLPALLETARVQAAATGESVSFLFDSLVRGIKRGSPLIIDNTGLVLDLSKANETLATQLGISVEQMTEEQKTIALINATVAAGADAVDQAGGIVVTAATRMATIQSLITNTIDNIARGVEPIVNAVLGAVTPVFAFIENASRSFGGFIQAVAKRITDFVGTFQTAFTLAQQIIQSGGEVVSNSFVGRIAGGAAMLFQIVSDNVTKIVEFLVGSIPAFFKAGASMFAALGNAYLAAANRFIFPVVVQIATFIADFLTGFSPAKRGPLSEIDKGAAGLATAWAGGFAGVFVPAAEDVAKEVDASLGKIGKFGIEKVTARLGQLDLAIRPFQERLAIVEAQFKAIQEPAQAAIDVIDKQLEKATQALASGDEGAAELVRKLNTERALFEQRLELNEDQVASAKLNLALVQAQQAEERALLTIQEKRLGVVDEVDKKTKKKKKDTKAAVDKAPTGGGAAPVTAPAGGGVTADVSGVVDEFLGNQAGEDALAGLDSILAGAIEFGGELSATLLEGLNAGGELDTALGFGDELQTQFGRIAESDPVQGIIGVFDGLTENLKTVGMDAVNGFLGFFTDASIEGSIPFFINDITTRGAAAVFGDITTAFTTWIQTSIVDPVKNGALLGLFDPTNPESVFAPFMTLGPRIVEVIGDLSPYFSQAFLTIGKWVFGETEDGGLPAIIDGIIRSIGGLPLQIFEVLKFIGLVFFDVFIAPFVSVVDSFIETVNDFLNQILDSEFINFLRSNPVTSSLFGDFPSSARILPLSSVINRSLFLPVAPPEVGGGGRGSGGGESVAHGARGGLFSEGLLNVGEKGPEKVFSAEPMGVFSNNFIRAMESISDMVMGGGISSEMGIPAPQSVTNNSSTDNSVTVNAPAGLKQSAADIANRIAVARVFGI